MNDRALEALSPLDGRYGEHLAPLAEIFSERGLMRRRVEIEVHWLLALCECKGLPEAPALSAAARRHLHDLHRDFGLADARRVKTLERRTRHDVKAVERWLREKLQRLSKRRGLGKLGQLVEFAHFACTSEDINNLAYALMIKQARDEVLLPAQHRMEMKLRALARKSAATPMLARTHGQSASPTTFGKELAVFALRLQRQRFQLRDAEIMGKINGAVGNFNAHRAAAADVDWPRLCAGVVRRLGLQHSPLTTQIEPRDWLAELMHALARYNTALLDLSRDCWQYTSLGYLRTIPKAGEVGSSTMPHKLNPIDFENAEGNIGLGNALLSHLAAELPVSRLQRDLSDSTAMRHIGAAFAHSLLAADGMHRGLQRADVDAARMADDLQERWEVLTEAVQTVMRRRNLPDPYEQLKKLSRGKPLSRDILRAFIDGADLPAKEKRELLALRPRDYIGAAPQLARQTLKSLGSR